MYTCAMCKRELEHVESGVGAEFGIHKIDKHRCPSCGLEILVFDPAHRKVSTTPKGKRKPETDQATKWLRAQFGGWFENIAKLCETTRMMDTYADKLGIDLKKVTAEEFRDLLLMESSKRIAPALERFKKMYPVNGEKGGEQP